MKDVSIHEIARLCGVSAMTVSRALDPAMRSKVKEKTRTKILEACDRHHFYPKFSARSLASGKTNSIGLVLALETLGSSPTLSLFVKFLVEELKKSNYTVSILPISGGNPETTDREIMQTFLSCRVDGFVLMACHIGEMALAEIKQRHFPAATFLMPSEIQTCIAPMNRVSVDNSCAFSELFEHLQGRKIAMVGVEGAHNCRRSEWIEVIKKRETGVSEKDFFMFPYAEYRNMGETLAAYRLVHNEWKRMKRYDAFIAMNDHIAIGLREAFRDKGVSGAAVAGFDDIEGYLRLSDGEPEITTISPPFREFGAVCASMILAQIANPELPMREIVIKSKLIIRKSTSTKET